MIQFIFIYNYSFWNPVPQIINNHNPRIFSITWMCFGFQILDVDVDQGKRIAKKSVEIIDEENADIIITPEPTENE